MRIAVLLPIFFLMTVLAAGADLILRSPALVVSMDKRTGRFSLRTTGGNPLEEKDSSIEILDSYTVPPTTHVSVRYGERTALVGGPDGMVIESTLIDKRIVYRWMLDDLTVTQTLTLRAGREPSCTINYTLTNTRKAVRTGLRLALDTSVSNAFIGAVSEMTRVMLHTNCRSLASWYSIDVPKAPSIFLRYDVSTKALSHTTFSFWRFFEQPWGSNTLAVPLADWAFSPNDDRGIGIYWDAEVRPDTDMSVSCTIYTGSPKTDSNFIMRTVVALPDTTANAPAVSTSANAVTEIETATNITFIFPDVNFDEGSAILRREAYVFLDTIGEALKRRAGRRFAINGHTDARGTEAYNRKLSEERARAVYNYLIFRFKVDERLCKINGFGAAFPVAENATPEGQAKNRRVEIVIEK